MYSDNVMLVGDAAGFPKPTSGGGIYTGLVSARAAANVGARALKSGNLSSRVLKDYERESLKDIGPELRNTFTVRKIYMGMTDNQVEDAFDILADPEIVAYISKHGDIDYPFKLAKGLLAKMPRLFRFFLPLIKGFVFDYR